MDSQQPFTPPDFTTARPVFNEPTTPQPAPPAPQHGIFSGRFGLRAGWGMLIFAVLLIIFTISLSLGLLAATGKLKPMIEARQKATLAQQNHTAPPPAPVPSTEAKPKGTVINEGLTIVALGLAAWLMSVFERRRTAVYGIGANRLMDFLPGAFWGVAFLSALVGILRACHLLVFDARLLSGSVAFLFGLKWLLAFLFVGIFEEYLFRGYLQFTLMRGLYGLAERISAIHARAVAFWMAAVLLSACFLLAHGKNTGETATGLFSVFLAGIVFTYALWRTGSLWWAIGFHMTWDWAQSFLYGVPDSGGLSAGRLFQTHPTGNPLLSGGSVGPEGSLFLIPIVILVAVVIRFTTKPGPQPALEPIPQILEDSSESRQLVV
jgi:membrane protease YdiL (CAAX protease family)